ncbi:FkbM family methyltransferase [Chryseobacterium sp. HSC-36S06]|uniref:FkbM family methyltransferase n=1 Tax=Chryseobacterium sp. HSC-36S06 TaxID=2910970 RepID=UPI00209CAEB3|nr:FkbM family methyltransferase [Chryseobacterium sp. HSC-36S06]MCP2037484.1 FkbM family methyltransferase [Chryseobacterium sp. HSC-36S06]
MTRREHLRKTVKNIKNQFVGEPVHRRHFLAAFYNHYISKNLRLPVFIRFPKAQFKYQNVTLETRPNTIDFWATLESYEPDLTQFLTEFLNGEKGTFIDVGAHIGRFSTLMSKQGWKVISFEPLKTNFRALEHNLKSNGVYENAQIFNAGLGNKTDNETIYFNSLELGEASVSEKNGDSKDEVKILRFDDLYQDFEIENLCIVKVDVEGYEEEVLEGMHEFVSKHKPLFVIELWAEKSPKLVEFLKSQGYKRLHIFWFVEEKHSPYISQMYERYNRYQLNYDYE